MSDREPQLPEPFRQALKDRTAFKPPETFYQDVLRTIRNKEQPRSPWAWLWGAPVKLAATIGVAMIASIAVKNQAPWGPKKAAEVEENKPKRLAAKNKDVARRDIVMAGRAVAMGEVEPTAALEAKLAAPLMWNGRISRSQTFRTVVVTTPAQWDLLWQTYFDARPPLVDFTSSMVVGVFTGSRPDLVGVRIVQTLMLPGHLQVIYREIPADAGETNPTNSPYFLRVIPKTALPISFAKQR